MSKRDRTRAHLLECALELFETRGFETTTVKAIATAAGVSEMTFFRYFPTKDAVAITDPFDPEIAGAIAAQPLTDDPLDRAIEGVRAALGNLAEADVHTTRTRVRLVASSTRLRAAAGAQNAKTEAAIRDQLAADGVGTLAAAVVAAAVIAALTAALYEWATAPNDTLPGVIERALDVLAGGTCHSGGSDG